MITRTCITPLIVFVALPLLNNNEENKDPLAYTHFNNLHFRTALETKTNT